RHTGDGAGQSVRLHENAGWAGDRSVPNDGADGSDLPACSQQGVMNARHRQNGTDTGDGIARGNQHGVSVRDRVDYSGSRLRIGSPGEAHGLYRILIPALHEIFFETELTDRGIDTSFYSRVAHGQNPCLHAELL